MDFVDENSSPITGDIFGSRLEYVGGICLLGLKSHDGIYFLIYNQIIFF